MNAGKLMKLSELYYKTCKFDDNSIKTVLWIFLNKLTII